MSAGIELCVENKYLVYVRKTKVPVKNKYYHKFIQHDDSTFEYSVLILIEL
jgi:hypothetical protein